MMVEYVFLLQAVVPNLFQQSLAFFDIHVVDVMCIGGEVYVSPTAWAVDLGKLVPGCDMV
jgi:hypothetical protein